MYVLFYVGARPTTHEEPISIKPTYQQGIMKITSSAFENEKLIPPIYTCDGANVNPPLAISGVPEGARSLVLLMDDPDVPKSIRPDGTWDHWVIYNIPPSTREVLEGMNPPGTPGVGTSGKQTYGGPCPPDREHRYFFKLYALDIMLEFKKAPTKSEVEFAMMGHTIEEATLMGRYNRKR